MTTFLKALPRYDDATIVDAEIERIEADIRAKILSDCVEVIGAHIYFDKVSADENTDVENDGLYLGTHRCVGYGIFTDDGQLVVELWATVVPDDEEYRGTDWW